MRHTGRKLLLRAPLFTSSSRLYRGAPPFKLNSRVYGEIPHRPATHSMRIPPFIILAGITTVIILGNNVLAENQLSLGSKISPQENSNSISFAEISTGSPFFNIVGGMLTPQKTSFNTDIFFTKKTFTGIGTDLTLTISPTQFSLLMDTGILSRYKDYIEICAPQYPLNLALRDELIRLSIKFRTAPDALCQKRNTELTMQDFLHAAQLIEHPLPKNSFQGRELPITDSVAELLKQIAVIKASYEHKINYVVELEKELEQEIEEHGKKRAEEIDKPKKYYSIFSYFMTSNKNNSKQLENRLSIIKQKITEIKSASALCLNKLIALEMQKSELETAINQIVFFNEEYNRNESRQMPTEEFKLMVFEISKVFGLPAGIDSFFARNNSQALAEFKELTAAREKINSKLSTIQSKPKRSQPETGGATNFHGSIKDYLQQRKSSPNINTLAITGPEINSGIFSHARIEPDELIELMQATIEDGIKNLNLLGCTLGKHSGLVLKHALPHCTQLEKLELHSSQLDEVSLIDLLEGLVHNKSMQTFMARSYNVERRYWSKCELKALQELIMCNHSLQEILLPQNEIKNSADLNELRQIFSYPPKEHLPKLDGFGTLLAEGPPTPIVKNGG